MTYQVNVNISESSIKNVVDFADFTLKEVVVSRDEAVLRELSNRLAITIIHLIELCFDSQESQRAHEILYSTENFTELSFTARVDFISEVEVKCVLNFNFIN